MKKLTKVLALAAILLVASACSSSKIEDAAIDKLEAGFKKMAEIKSFDYKLDLNAESEQMIIKLYGSLFAKDGFAASAVLDLSANGVAAEKFMEFYIKDSMMYTSMLGQKQKQAFEVPAALDLSLSPETMPFDREEVKKSFSEITLTGDTLHLVVNKEVFDENLAKLGDAASSVGTVDEVKSIVIDIEFENDFIKKISLILDAKVEGKEQKVELTLALDNINGVESVSFPEDLDTYVETESTIPGLDALEGIEE